MTKLAIALPDELDQFIRDRVASGAYSNEAEAVADAVRLLAAECELSEQGRLDALKLALQPGLNDIAAERFSDRTVADFVRDAKSPR
ncbi:MAG: type II toxin-antitoxin system ParD family antitoxin [Hyphomonadaceae bacterium]